MSSSSLPPLPPRPRPPGSREEARRKSYKALVTEDRKKREDSMVETRNNIRHDTLLKNRTHLAPQSPTLAHLQLQRNHAMIQKIWSREHAAQLEATKHFCNVMEIEGGLLIEEVINTGIVPRFADFLGMHDAPQLQIQAASALSILSAAKSEHALLVIRLGVVPLFVNLLLHSGSTQDVREHAIWGLGNLAADSPASRDLVLKHGALLPILAQLSHPTNNNKLVRSVWRVGAWAISNLCRGIPPPEFQEVKAALPKLREVMVLFRDDEEMIEEACTSLSCIMLASTTRPAIPNIQAVLDTGLCPILVHLLRHPKYEVISAGLRSVGNLLNGDHTQAQVVIDIGVLPCLHKLITINKEVDILKEACSAISNITAGTTKQVQAVIDADIIPPLEILLLYAEMEIKIEAAWAIVNATNAGTQDQIKAIVNNGRCIKALCDMLVSSDPTGVMVCLEGLDDILTVGEADKIKRKGGSNTHAQKVVVCAGLDKIRKLQTHSNTAIKAKAVNMLNKYFNNTNNNQQQQQQDDDFTFDVPIPPPTRLPPG